MSDYNDEDCSDWEDYESGPFCRHWHETWDCTECCARCEVDCTNHDDDECEWEEDHR